MPKTGKSPTIDKVTELLRRRLKEIAAERSRLERALVDLGGRKKRS